MNPYLEITKSKIGKIHKNKIGLEAIVLDVTNKRNKSGNVIFKCKFIESGYEFDIEYKNLKSGNFKDYGRPTVFGVGYSNRGAKIDKHIYKTWNHMLERCCNTKFHAYHKYGGAGVKVCERWFYLKNFTEDIKEIPNYKEYIENPFLYSLDKDIRGNGKLYSKETCVFATAKQQIQAQERVKKIKCISPDGLETIYNSKGEACKATGVQNANLYKVLSGERKHSLGYKFIELE